MRIIISGPGRKHETKKAEEGNARSAAVAGKMREQSERASCHACSRKDERCCLLKLSSSRHLREIVWERREGRERANEREELRAHVRAWLFHPAGSP